MYPGRALLVCASRGGEKELRGTTSQVRRALDAGQSDRIEIFLQEQDRLEQPLS